MDCIIPAKISAGVNFDSLATLTAYPAPDWVLSALLRGPSTIDLVASAEGSQHRFVANGAATKDWTPGVYRYSLRATQGDDVEQIDSGTVEILADVADIVDGTLLVSHARKVLDAIEAVLEKRATQDQQKYVINNRELWRTPIQDLLLLRSTYRAEVRREDSARCGCNLWGPAAQVRF